MPGADLAGRKAGTRGDVGVLSFGGSKLLSAGRGGALLTNRNDVVQRARVYSHRGNEAYPLSELQAAVLVPQLEQLDERNLRRAQSVRRLLGILADTGLVPFRNALANSCPGYYKLGFQYAAESFGGLPRDEFTEVMRVEGIAMDPGFRAAHLIHSARRYRRSGELVNATKADSNVVVLHHPVLLEEPSHIEQIGVACAKIATHASALRKHFASTISSDGQ